MGAHTYWNSILPIRMATSSRQHLYYRSQGKKEAVSFFPSTSPQSLWLRWCVGCYCNKHTMPVTFYRYFKCHGSYSVPNRGFCDCFQSDISRRKIGDSDGLFLRKPAVLLSYLSCSVMCLFFSCSLQPQPPWRRTMPCRDMGTLINVLRAGGISILDAAE